MGIHNLCATCSKVFSSSLCISPLISNWNFANCSLLLIFFFHLWEESGLFTNTPTSASKQKLDVLLVFFSPFKHKLLSPFCHICVPPLDLLQFVIVLKAPNRTCLSRDDLKSAEIEKNITFSDLLLIQSSRLLAFCATRAYCWLIFHLLSTMTPKFSSAKLQDFAFALADPHEVSLSPFLQPAEIPVNNCHTTTVSITTPNL